MADSNPSAPGGYAGSASPASEPREDIPTGQAGELLFRRYRIERELGRGGMGRVMLAFDTALAIHVAIKLVPEIVAKDTDAVSDLRKEVLRGIALMHPGIVRTHNFERDDQGSAIVMEYIEGHTLSELKADEPAGCFDAAQILPWLEQLCGVLDYAHRDARIVHRDLKPRNVMLTSQGRIKVADFGIAATLSDSQSRHSMEGVNSGTPPYMSPQQAQGKRPTALDDVYALGATIYELLTGKPPFFRGNILLQVLSEVPPRMGERRAELEVEGHAPISPVWEETIAACLAKEPADRPPSAGEVLRRLREETPADTVNSATVAMTQMAPPKPQAAAPAPPPLPREQSEPATTRPPEVVPAPPAATAPPAVPATLPPTLPPQFAAPVARRASVWPWVVGVAFIVVAAGAGIYFSGGPSTQKQPSDPRKAPESPPPPAPVPSVPKLLAEARTLRQNEAYTLARARLQAALAIEPGNAEVLAELAAIDAALAPKSVAPATPAPPPEPRATPVPALPAASLALIRQITASSTLASQVDNDGRRNFYDATKVIDGKVATAWVAARGAQEVWLRVDFEREVSVSRFTIFPGYGKDADAFAKNNRIKSFALEFAGGRTFQFRCEDRRTSQTFALPEPVSATSLTVRVLEVYRAEKYTGDTPISEIGF